MATVYYLNWDKEGSDEEREFFHQSHNIRDNDMSLELPIEKSDNGDVMEIPNEWYREIITVESNTLEDIWTALQNDIPIQRDDINQMRRKFEDVQERSMSVGDIVEVNNTLHMALYVGFTEVKWKDS